MTIRIFTYFLSRFIAGIAYFLSSLIIISNFTHSEYATYSISLSSAQIVSALIGSWVGLSANILIPNTDSAKSSRAIGAFSAMSILASILATLILFFILNFSSIRIPSTFIIPALLLCFAFSLHESQMYITNSSGNANAYSISIIFRYLIGAFGVLLAVNFTIAGREYSLLSLAVGSLLALLIPQILKQIRAAFKVDLQSLREYFNPMIRTGLASVIVFGLWAFSTYTVRLFLHLKGENAQLGIFSATTDLINGPVVLIFQALHLAWGPVVIAAFNGNKFENFQLNASNYISATILLAIPSLAAFWCIGDDLLALIAGNGLVQHGQRTVFWVAATTICSSIFGVGGLILLTSGYKKNVVMITLITLIINAILVSNITANASGMAKFNTLSMVCGILFIYAFTYTKTRIYRYILLLPHAIVTASAILILDIYFSQKAIDVNPLVALSVYIIITAIIYYALNIFKSREIIRMIIKEKIGTKHF